MKKILACLSSLFVASLAFAGTIVIEGKYQNKNIYVQNFFSNSGVGYCAQEIKVNGQITTDETNSSAFEIDLSALNLKFGQEVIVEIFHKDGCMPKVLNADDLKPKPTFDVLAISLSETGLLKWSTKNETGSLPYIIETFKWNKWIPVAEVNGIGSPDQHDYEFQLSLHSGNNKIRVKQKGTKNITRYSGEVTSNSTVKKPSYVMNKDNSVSFSQETAYEVYDAYGIIVKKGFGKSLKMDNLKKGVYYLCYDNEVSEVKR